jgi:hypothetical protein
VTTRLEIGNAGADAESETSCLQRDWTACGTASRNCANASSPTSRALPTCLSRDFGGQVGMKPPRAEMDVSAAATAAPNRSTDTSPRGWRPAVHPVARSALAECWPPGRRVRKSPISGEDSPPGSGQSWGLCKRDLRTRDGPQGLCKHHVGRARQADGPRPRTEPCSRSARDRHREGRRQAAWSF